MKAIIVLIGTIFLFYACSTDQPTSYQHKINLVDIQKDSNWVEVTDTMSVDLSCLSGDSLSNLKNIVIRDSSEYAWFNSIIWRYTNCIDFQLPEINFNQYSLVGLITKTGPGDNISRSIWRNNIENKYFYNVHITITGWEKALVLITNYNFLLIPKIPENYEITMDTTLRFKI